MAQLFLFKILPVHAFWHFQITLYLALVYGLLVLTKLFACGPSVASVYGVGCVARIACVVLVSRMCMFCMQRSCVMSCTFGMICIA